MRDELHDFMGDELHDFMVKELNLPENYWVQSSGVRPARVDANYGENNVTTATETTISTENLTTTPISLQTQSLQCFILVREIDETGISGTGVVAEGIKFSDGTCAMRWTTKTTSTAIYNSINDLIEIHGHQGKTRLVWLD